MMYVKLPKLMSINVRGTTHNNMVKLALLKAQHPSVIVKALELLEKEIAEDEAVIAKAAGKEKKALEALLAEKQKTVAALTPPEPKPVKKATK